MPRDFHPLGSTRKPGRPALRAVLFIALVPAPVTILFPRVLSGPVFEICRFDAGPVALAGWALVAGGAMFFASAIREFLRAGSSPAPWDTTAHRLLVGGPFAHTRNPLFLSVVTILAGEALLYESTTAAAYAALLWAGFHARVILFEERRLLKTYGLAYQEYLAHVPRWVVVKRDR